MAFLYRQSHGTGAARIHKLLILLYFKIPPTRRAEDGLNHCSPQIRYPPQGAVRPIPRARAGCRHGRSAPACESRLPDRPAKPTNTTHEDCLKPPGRGCSPPPPFSASQRRTEGILRPSRPPTPAHPHPNERPASAQPSSPLGPERAHRALSTGARAHPLAERQRHGPANAAARQMQGELLHADRRVSPAPPGPARKRTNLANSNDRSPFIRTLPR